MKHNYLKASLLYLLVFLCGMYTSQAQTTITGKVTSQDDGSALPGVSVLVKGTTRGTTTNADGQYTLAVDGPNTVLVFSFISFVSQEVLLGNRSSVDIQLVPNLNSLSEVVVTGYTTQNRKEITGAVSTVKGKDLASVPMQNAEQQLQGRIAGVTVLTSGQPGTTSQVRIRGFGSLVNNNPLYIVDGVPTQDISFLNSFDIDDMSVLKDAGAASVYGARAASGVIVVTTKHAKSGSKINVSYDTYVGATVAGKGMSLLSPQEQADYTWTALKNGGTTSINHVQYGSGATPVLPYYLLVGNRYGLAKDAINLETELAKSNTNFDNGSIYQVIRTNVAGTDWYKEITRRAPVTNHSIGISGSGENSRYYIGLGYTNTQGILLHQYAKRYSLRTNTEFSIKKILRLGTNMQVNYGDQRLINNNNEGNPIAMAFRMSPAIPVYDEKGGWAGTVAKGFANPKNPVAMLTRAKDDKNSSLGLFGNVYAEVDVLPHLIYRTSFGGSISHFYYQNFVSKEYENAENNGTHRIIEGAGYQFDWTFTNTLQYELKSGMHAIRPLLGVEAVRSNVGRRIDGVGLEPFSTNVPYRTLSTTQGAGRQVTSGVPPWYDARLYSIFSKIDYTFKDRYLASVTLRRDASSAFGRAKREGYFPAVSLGWRVTQENFMQNIPWLSELKIRGGWGIMGNQAINPNNQYSTAVSDLLFASYDMTGSNGSAIPGFRIGNIANEDGAWEKNISTNIGFDANLFAGRLEVVFDYYTRLTKDMLFNPEISGLLGSVGRLNAPYINIGQMENKGIDLQLIYKGAVASGAVKFEVGAIVGAYKNKVIKLDEFTPYFDAYNGTNRMSNPVRNAEGEPISSFFGYKVAGLWQSNNDIKKLNEQVRTATKDTTAVYQEGAGIGRFQFEDINGDGRITDKDRTFIGNPNPDFTYGLNLKVSFKNIELEANLYGVQGNEVFNYSRWFTDFYSSFSGAALSTRVKDAWTPENTGATTPRLEAASNFSTNTQSNSYYVESGSYLRMRNLQLGYNLPSTLLNKLKIARLKVYVQAINPFTITSYSGLDPGISGQDTSYGVDNGFYPMTRQYNVGLSLGF